jgi:LysR family glycine cleavage system transcriptional activator
MCRRTLPLNALRAFEVAARHKSLAKAAEELSVTPAAIHHQVKALEGLLGVQLFGRAGNSLALTKAAAAALPTLEGAFDLLSLAIEKMRQHTSSGVLFLAVCPSFAQRWLIPRLSRFREDFEGIELRIATTGEAPDLANSEIDIAIGYGPEAAARG